MGCPRFRGAGGRLLGEGCIPAPQLWGEIRNESGRPGENPAARLGQPTPPSTDRALTVRVLVIHHVQIILICFHVSQQIVRRDVAALCLLVVCVRREREISSSPSVASTSPISCPGMPGCVQVAQLPTAVTFLAPTATTVGVMGAKCPFATP